MSFLEDLADHDGAVLAGIGGDLTRRPRYRLLDDLDAVFLVFVLSLYLVEGLGRLARGNERARRGSAGADERRRLDFEAARRVRSRGKTLATSNCTADLVHEGKFHTEVAVLRSSRRPLGGTSGRCFLRRRKEQVGWHAETGAQTMYQRHAQPLLATHYLTHAAWGAEERDQVRSCETVLIHEVAEQIGDAR